MFDSLREIEMIERQIDRWLPPLYDPDIKADWKPIPGPQVLALESEADELFYGGQAGGGKTDLLIGAAITQHRKSIIFRREYPQLKDIIGRSVEILEGTDAKYNGLNNTWRNVPGNRSLEFGAVQYEKDKNKFKGRPHDLKAFDELPEFSESLYVFLIGWARTVELDQRVRVIGTGNPPTSAEGEWVIRRFAPWLDDKHPNPAEPGELRWFSTVGGKDTELENGDPFVDEDGKTIVPKSRTFIPASLDDNPYLKDSGYRSVLQGMPEPLRSQLLYGDFSVGMDDDIWQVIPTEWVRLAFGRWEEKTDNPITTIGADISRGGKDQTVIAKRYGNWLAPLIKFEGREVPDGPTAARLIFGELEENELGVRINVDSIGVGSSALDSLRGLRLNVHGVVFSEGSESWDKSGKYKMKNLRAEAYWRMREALDPITGDDLAFPPDNELLADLTTPKYKVPTGSIQIESKEDIIKRIGRSPDCGDAVVMAFMQTEVGRGI